MNAYDIEAEEAVLGAVLLSNVALPFLIADHDLRPEHFYSPRHRTIWTAMLRLHDAGHQVDRLTLIDDLRRNDDLNDDTLTEAHVDLLTIAVPGVGNVRRYAEIVVERAHWRNRLHAAQDMQAACLDGDEDLFARAESRLKTVDVEGTETTNADSVGHEVVDWLEKVDEPVGISTGFVNLDRFLGGGLHPNDTTALGGWTGMGKSALADQVLTHAAHAGRRCHAYVNEMSTVDRALRMLARSGVAPYSKLVVRDRTGLDWDRVLEAAGQIPFGITECSQWSPDRIARHIRTNAWDICVLDHIHNMPFRDTAELDHAVATLCGAARAAGTHLIMVVQFNQERNKGDFLPHPTARDIRGTGMIEKQCASILLLHREQNTGDHGLVYTEQTGYIKAEKARHGEQGARVQVEFDHERMSFDPVGLRSVA